MSYLLLAQDEDPSRFDGVPGWEVFPWTFLHPVLVGLPGTIARWPRHAHVMPFPIFHSYGHCHRLKKQVEEQVDRDRNTINEECLDSGQAAIHGCKTLLQISLIWIKLYFMSLCFLTVLIISPWLVSPLSWYSVLTSVTRPPYGFVIFRLLPVCFLVWTSSPSCKSSEFWKFWSSASCIRV